MRIDRHDGASFGIPPRVFQEIENTRLLIAALTDEKPNVYCGIGYAKARGIPFFLKFQEKAGDPTKAPGASPTNRVHFGLAPYRYNEYETTLDLRDKLKQELDAWHENHRNQ